MSPLQAWQICAVFGSASLLSVGGGNAIVPQLQRETVLDQHWLTAAQFADSFAIAQVAPGPSSLLVTLLGYHAAGLSGALLATAAMVLQAVKSYQGACGLGPQVSVILHGIWPSGEPFRWSEQEPAQAG